MHSNWIFLGGLWKPPIGQEDFLGRNGGSFLVVFLREIHGFAHFPHVNLCQFKRASI